MINDPARRSGSSGSAPTRPSSASIWPPSPRPSRWHAVTAQLFFATWLFPLGCLVYKSGSLPRFLVVLLVLDGIAVLVWFLQALLLPDYPAIRYPGLIVSFIAEVGLACGSSSWV